MDHNEYRDALDKLGISQRELARRILRTDERTTRRYALDESEVPRSLELLIRLWLRDPETLEATRAIVEEQDKLAERAERRAAAGRKGSK